MMLAAADINVSTQVPATIASWLECLVFVLGAIYLTVSLYRSVAGKPAHPPNSELEIEQKQLQVRVTKLEDSLVGKEWFEKVDGDLSALKSETAAHRIERDRQDSIHRASIYRKIDEVRQELNHQMEANRKELSENIGQQTSQIIAVLKNTGAI